MQEADRGPKYFLTNIVGGLKRRHVKDLIFDKFVYFPGPQFLSVK